MSTRPDDTAEQPRRPHLWSWQVAKVWGIPVRIHITFLLLILLIFMMGGKDLEMILLVILVFICVILHELGHALVGKSFGVNTRDITIYPIGGVAMLQNRPKPYQEFWIALAGPAVNAVIATILGVYLFARNGHLPNFTIFLDPNGSLIENLYMANVWLPLFNLIPAFPMDGGRVLRAFLAFFMPEERATRIAGGIGQFLAFAFGFAALLNGQILWMVIAVFVFLGAGQEVQASVGLSLVAGKKVSDAMQHRFRTMPSGASLEDAAHMLLDGSQHDFPVMAGDEIVGVLSRTDIARGLATDGPTAYIAGFMTRDIHTVSPDAALEGVFEIFSQSDGAPLLVLDNGQLVGMLTPENFSEFLMLEHARSRNHYAPTR